MYIYIYISATVPLARMWSALGRWLVSGPWGSCNYCIKGPPGNYLFFAACRRMDFDSLFFDIVFQSIFEQVFIDFWSHLDLQNRPKIGPSSMKNRSKLTSKFPFIF